MGDLIRYLSKLGDKEGLTNTLKVNAENGVWGTFSTVIGELLGGISWAEGSELR